MVKIDLPYINKGLDVDFWFKAYAHSNSTYSGHMQWILKQEVF